jgi:NDP-sugar pyrophosphorylase family protein
MAAIAGTLLKVAGKALISMVMSMATEEFFKDVFMMLAEKAAQSSKTNFDNKLVARMRDELEKRG